MVVAAEEAEAAALAAHVSLAAERRGGRRSLMRRWESMPAEGGGGGSPLLDDAARPPDAAEGGAADLDRTIATAVAGSSISAGSWRGEAAASAGRQAAQGREVRRWGSMPDLGAGLDSAENNGPARGSGR